jgi:hypothetical protein
MPVTKTTNRRAKSWKEKKRSFVKIELENKAAMARREAAAPRGCSCTGPKPCPCTALWLGRAERLERLKGDRCVAIYNLRLDPQFWPTVDKMPLGPPPRAPKKPKSAPGVSLQSQLGLMLRTASKKALQEAAKNNGATFWADRAHKLTVLSVQDAAPLIPHLGKSGVWAALDSIPTP